MFVIGKHCHRGLNCCACTHCVTVNVSAVCVYTVYFSSRLYVYFWSADWLFLCITSSLPLYGTGLLIMFSSAADETSNCIWHSEDRASSYIYSYNGSQQDTLFLNFILIYNSTCFGQTYCPSSEVWYCIHSNWYLSYYLCCLIYDDWLLGDSQHK